jgi:hypothetical protein
MKAELIKLKRDCGWWVCYNDKVASQGKTKYSAIKHFAEAYSLYEDESTDNYCVDCRKHVDKNHGFKFKHRTCPSIDTSK